LDVYPILSVCDVVSGPKQLNIHTGGKLRFTDISTHYKVHLN
jgi:hypothetical protein